MWLICLNARPEKGVYHQHESCRQSQASTNGSAWRWAMRLLLRLFANRVRWRPLGDILFIVGYCSPYMFSFLHGTEFINADSAERDTRSWKPPSPLASAITFLRQLPFASGSKRKSLFTNKKADVVESSGIKWYAEYFSISSGALLL